MFVLQIQLDYVTHGEERLWLVMKADAVRIPMCSEDQRLWYCGVKQEKVTEYVDFRFEVRDAQGEKVLDSERNGFWHRWIPLSHRKEQYVRCFWQTQNEHSYLYSQAYQDNLFHWKGCLQKWDGPHDALLVIPEFVVPMDEELLITGNHPSLGMWHVEKGLPLRQMGTYMYGVALNCSEWPYAVEYKFVLRNKLSGSVIWEEGNNRIMMRPDSHSMQLEVDSAPRLPASDGNIAGLAIPVFSLRSENSCGVGDFGDLGRMIEWASHVGMHAVQVLPVNDTTRTGSWEDSYPYNGISVYALHPMFLDLRQLRPLKDRKTAKEWERERKRLNALPQVDYEAVNQLKNKWLSLIYQEHAREEVVPTDDFRCFTEENEDWIWTYCCFRVLQKEKGTSDFRLWRDLAQYDECKLRQWIGKKPKRKDELMFHAWVQFELDRQMKAVHQLARTKGVVIKGDIPIGISRNSATSWRNRDYFHFEGQAGAPPDFFSEKGQNWGFPTYCWDNILRDNGAWWQRRLQKMSDYFDAIRLDHVLGFFRIWEIPSQALDGRLGYFSPALPLSQEDLANMGFRRDVASCLDASFTDWELQNLFHHEKDKWKALFMKKEKDGLWHFRKNFDTQKKLLAFFTKGNVPHEVEETLLAMQAQVLFIKDSYSEKFHPAISGQQSNAYHRLAESDRKAFDAIHRDYFYIRHNRFWADEAMKRLPCVVQSNRMLICAEDLGMIPASVKPVLDDFHILSLEVQSMPKREGEGEFSEVGNNPHLSVDTITTHDMEPLRLWWSRHHEAARRYWEQRMGGQGVLSEELSGADAERILQQHLNSPSLLCILSFQDWLAMDEQLRNPRMEEEQINQPANPRHYWRYRMHISLEDLMKAQAFNDRIRRMIEESGRCY